LMQSDVTVAQEGKVKKLPRGKRALDKVKWVYQDKIGYIFPEPTTIHLSNQAENGRWSDITDQKNISQEIVSKDVFKLWFDHGSRPQNGSYQYMVVPNISEQKLMEDSRNNRHIEILANRSDVQAVKHNKLGQCQIAFYGAAEVRVSTGLTVGMDSQGMAMLKMENNKIQELTVADPSRKLTNLMVTVTGVYDIEGDHFITYPNTGQDVTVILVDLPQGVYAGKSVTVRLD